MKAVIANLEEILSKEGRALPSKAITPMTDNFKPEFDHLLEHIAELHMDVIKRILVYSVVQSN